MSTKDYVKELSKHIQEFKRDSILTPIMMVLEVIADTLLPFFMAGIVDEGVNKGDMRAIMYYGGLMLLCAIFGLFTGFGGGYFGARASTGFARNLRRDMFANIQRFSFAEIDKYSTSGLVTRLTTDVTNIQNAFQMLLRMCVRAPLSMIMAMFMAFLISPRIASIYLAAVVFLGIVMVLVMGKATRYFKEVFKKYDSLNESVEENLAAIRLVKAYNREEHENNRFVAAVTNLYKLFVQAENNIVMVMPVMTGTVYVVILFISWIGAHLIVQHTLTTGELMSLLTYCSNILMSLMFLAMIFVMMTMSVASANRIGEVLLEGTSVEQPENPVMEMKDGSIDFEDVDFSYVKGARQSVVKDVNLHINSGEFIGVIGGTGSAKSSLVNLICRLYDVTQGSVKVGGVDVSEYDLKTLRDNVAVVLQKNTLFSGTILDNLRWGNPDATEEECIEACKIACADDFISKFPEGYNTQIEQGGTNVSGGQRQRLCIARALLKKPKILILDDSTSAVDTATERRIREGMQSYLPGTTKIVITQRIAAVQGADRVIVLDEGRVNGFDTPEHLLETNAIYREVSETQMSGTGDFDEKGDD
ncbi:MAG: ABC transporter ATP-binding protein [Lachnospiraceae bacterium]|nr:ABC transporter ATP-binding protein [Candidatus Equihabitans merdae]